MNLRRPGALRRATGEAFLALIVGIEFPVQACSSSLRASPGAKEIAQYARHLIEQDRFIG